MCKGPVTLPVIPPDLARAHWNQQVGQHLGGRAPIIPISAAAPTQGPRGEAEAEEGTILVRRSGVGVPESMLLDS